MFQGASSISLDAKGRLSVPTRHREVITATADGQLTITRHPDGCLVLFPRPEWEKFRAKVAAWPLASHKWKRFFLGSAMDVEMDSAGRVLISPELREWVGIEKEVMLLGMGNHFELWEKTRYEASEADMLNSEIPDAVKQFSYI